VNAARFYEHQKVYYDRLAPEYDVQAWQGADAPADEIDALVAVLADIPAAKTLDVACGTGFLSQHLNGQLTILDASAEMLAIARRRVPHAETIQGDALPLPFSEAAFERLFSSAFYDHLMPAERTFFLEEAQRTAAELLLVEQRWGTDHREGFQRRTLSDGSEHLVYITFFSPASLVEELGGGEILFAGSRLIVARRVW
jgi:SAM-dependent methyltransferase